jgi:hypothetical protein
MRNDLRGDVTKPHLRKFFKTVPMKDEKGNDIPDNPPLRRGGPWAKPEMGIGQNLHKAKEGRK